MKVTPPRLLLALVISLGAAALLAQEPSPDPPAEASQESPPAQFEAEVEQVIVDLVVIDKKGNPVSGLGPDDMIVAEDGVPQEVVSFEAVALPVEPAPPTTRVAAAPEP